MTGLLLLGGLEWVKQCGKIKGGCQEISAKDCYFSYVSWNE